MEMFILESEIQDKRYSAIVFSNSFSNKRELEEKYPGFRYLYSRPIEGSLGNEIPIDTLLYEKEKEELGLLEINASLEDENVSLKERISELELKLSELESNSESEQEFIDLDVEETPTVRTTD